MSFPLAIVVPAYKLQFFSRMLDSLAAQTDKRFTLYVGIDGVDADFEAVAARYAGKIPMVVHRFADNMGSTDLVGQWHRCIDMIADEEWIWLFSDDDMLEAGCVEAFYRQLDEDGSFDLYHYNVNIIDSCDNIIKSATRFPAVMGALEFLKRKIRQLSTVSWWNTYSAAILLNVLGGLSSLIWLGVAILPHGQNSAEKRASLLLMVHGCCGGQAMPTSLLQPIDRGLCANSPYMLTF